MKDTIVNKSTVIMNEEKFEKDSNIKFFIPNRGGNGDGQSHDDFFDKGISSVVSFHDKK